MSGRPITNLSRKAEKQLTEAVLSGRVAVQKSKYLQSDSIALRGMTPASTSSWRSAEIYSPARDNPQNNVRPGADDHQRFASKGAETQAIYHDRGHA